MGERELCPPVTLLQPLQGLPRSVVVVRYGGGSDFASGDSLLQVQLPLSAVPEDVRARVTSLVADAVARASSYESHIAETLPPALPDTSTWTWDATLAVVQPPAASESESAAQQRLNCYPHGWLFAPLFDGGAAPSSAIAYPLIGVLDPSAGISDWRHRSRTGTSSSGGGSSSGGSGGSGTSGSGAAASAALDDVAAAGFAHLQPSDIHFHGVDPWAGGTAADYLQLLLDSGLDEETAAAIVAAEEATAGDYFLGSDAARVCYSGGIDSCWVVTAHAQAAGAGSSSSSSSSSGSGSGSATVRVLCTLLLILPRSSGHASSAVAAVRALASRACASHPHSSSHRDGEEEEGVQVGLTLADVCAGLQAVLGASGGDSAEAIAHHHPAISGLMRAAAAAAVEPAA